MKKTQMSPAEQLCQDGVVSRAKAAELLDINIRTLDKLLQRNELPYTRSSKVRKIPRSAITQYLANRLVGASSG